MPYLAGFSRRPSTAGLKHLTRQDCDRCRVNASIAISWPGAMLGSRLWPWRLLPLRVSCCRLVAGRSPPVRRLVRLVLFLV